jgi:hypothetical protein
MILASSAGLTDWAIFGDDNSTNEIQLNARQISGLEA